MAYVISDDCISCGQSTIRSTLMLALSVELAQVFAHLRLSAFPNAIRVLTNPKRSGNHSRTFFLVCLPSFFLGL